MMLRPGDSVFSNIPSDYSEDFARLDIMITYRCQFKCSYCGVEVDSHQDSNEELVKKSIDLLFTTKKKKLELQFFGGEALLRFDLIRTGIEYAASLEKSSGKEISFVIVTNGLALCDEILDYLSGYRATVIMSTDGMPKTNMKNRCMKGNPRMDSYSRLEDSLRMLFLSGVNYHVNMVVRPGNCREFFENFVYLYKLGAKRIQAGFSAGEMWDDESIKCLLEGFGKARDYSSEQGDLLFLNINNRSEPVVLCSDLIVDHDGKIYIDGCIFMERFFPTVRSEYLRGHIDEVDDIDSISADRRDTFMILNSSLKDPVQIKLFQNNLNAGIIINKFFSSEKKKTEDSRERESTRAEHSVLYRLLYSDLSKQETIKKELGLDIESSLLYVSTSCENDCIMCKRKFSINDMLSSVEKKISKNTTAGKKKIALVGNDVLCHSNPIGILKICRKYGFSEIEIMTSGNRLADKKLVDAMAGLGLKIVFCFPLFSMKAEKHDMIVGNKGAFQDVMSGIENIKRHENLSIALHTNILKQNIMDIADIEEFSSREDARFAVFPVRPKFSNSPYKDIVPSYSEIIKNVRSQSLVGFPLCVVFRMTKNIIPDSSVLSDSMKAYVLDQNFAKPKKCLGCAKFHSCCGTFREYVKLFGANEIEPF
jgi:sulfatase maturation enzyme AslB (radical SAM superfamily)